MPLPDFPFNDTDAAIAWLADESNHNFSEWEVASLEDKCTWEELEATLSTFTGLKSHSVMKIIKDKIHVHLSTENLKLRATSDQKSKIAEEAATAILESVETVWKEASRKWLVDALLVFTRRAIKLWKKGLHRKGEKAEVDQGTRDSIAPKRRKLNPKPEGHHENRAEGSGFVNQQLPPKASYSGRQSQVRQTKRQPP